MARIVVVPFKNVIKTLAKENLLNALIKAGFNIQAICGGDGTCGKCKIIVRSGGDALSKITSSERKLIPNDQLKNGYRLACCSTIEKEGKIQIEIPTESLTEYQKLSVIGLEPDVSLNPSIKKVQINLSKTTLENINSDFDRILDALLRKGFSNRFHISYKVLRNLPKIMREAEWKVTVTIWNDEEIVCIEKGDTTKRNYGVAFDIGTTKIAGYLIDLNEGTLLASDSRLNSQRKFGEDIISRITKIMKNEQNLNELNKLVIDDVNYIINHFCSKYGIKDNEIFDLTFVGNTAMHHIFLNLLPIYLTLSPYPPVIRGALNVRIEKLGIKANSNCYAHAIPVIAGFVGSDAIADIIATDLFQTPKLSMLIDIGTNAEIVLGNRDKLFACSCASGPAFEGAHIKHGMRAQKGAIEKIRIDPESLEVTYEVIGDVKPEGICGSGIVDGVAELYKAQIINGNGLINAEKCEDRILKKNGLKEFILVTKNESGTQKEITITQSDIREIQLAKAAIFAGCSILMRTLGISSKDIKRLFLAGSFGTYLNPNSAKAIGIFPIIPDECIEFVGNTAGSGARLALKSKRIREVADDIADKVNYVELGAVKGFQKDFLDATIIPHRNIKLFER